MQGAMIFLEIIILVVAAIVINIRRMAMKRIVKDLKEELSIRGHIIEKLQKERNESYKELIELKHEVDDLNEQLHAFTSLQVSLQVNKEQKK